MKLRIHVFALAFVSLFVSTGKAEDCKSLLVRNVVAREVDLSTTCSLYKIINETNYEELKRDAGGNYGIYGANYSDFQEKKHAFLSMFQHQETSDLSEKYLQHSLSADGARAYADCIAKTSKSMLTVWIDKQQENVIAIGVRNGLPGASKVTYEIHPASDEIVALNKPKPLLTGSSQMLLFKRNPKKDFLIVINASEEKTGAEDSASIDLPRTRNFQKESSYDELTAKLECGAGCQGNVEGCARSLDIEFAAKPGYQILPQTRKRINVQVIPPGLARYSIEWTETKEAGKVVRLHGRPIGMVGNSPHTQGNVIETWSVMSVKESIVEVTD